ncbi:MAG: ABC transporter permease subunit [Anaerolineales bacterium]|nr:ABC transporter permease subunit [Anaerolineales bacterium]
MDNPALDQLPSDHVESNNIIIRRAAPWNWQLWLGTILVGLVCFLAFFGAGLAPRDPMEVNYIVQHPETKEFIKPPLAPFDAPGFPLGSDLQGRDYLSQLLWAVRPTLQLVILVAAFRLVIGLIIGLAAGWSVTWFGKSLDSVISWTLALPVLFVALVLIAALGIKLGSAAFLLGLTLTGWAETAQLVRDVTKTNRGQPFIEAARALGLTQLQIVSRHILPQILPLMWTLFSFEISNTLMTVAGLGFLGYYMYAIWVPMGDTSALRTSGRAEIGQMLASGVSSALKHPWGLVIAGSAVFVIILAFNLFGEGLRLRQERLRYRSKKNAIGKMLERTENWVEERWFGADSAWRRNAQTALIVVFLAAVVVAGGVTLFNSQSQVEVEAVVKGNGQMWASELSNAQGTMWMEAVGPQEPVFVWSFSDPSGFSGGPVLDKDGNIYLTSNGGRVYSLSRDGVIRWWLSLQTQFCLTPVLDKQGNMYAADIHGRVWAFSPQGKKLWKIDADAGEIPISSPVIDEQGTIYLVNQFHLLAISDSGNLLWKVRIPKYSYINPKLRLSYDEDYIFFDDVVISVATGDIVFGETKDDQLDKYIVGTDGKTYLSALDSISEFQTGEGAASILKYVTWDAVTQGLSVRQPMTAGVIPDGRTWTLYSGYQEYMKLIWVDRQGQIFSNAGYPWRDDSYVVIGLDNQATFYACGVNYNQRDTIQCRANRVGQNEPFWMLDMEIGKIQSDWTYVSVYNSNIPAGGAMAPGRLYVVTSSGMLYAIGESSEMITQAISKQPTVTPLARVYWYFFPMIGR